MSSIGNPLAYELHLFSRFRESQKVTEIGRNVFPVVHAISLNVINLSKPVSVYRMQTREIIHHYMYNVHVVPSVCLFALALLVEAP